MNHLAYPRRGGSRARTVGLAVLTLFGGFACAAGVRATGTGSGGSDATGASGGSTSKTGSGGFSATGQGATGGLPSTTGAGGTFNPDAAACQQKDVMFTALNPTVFILVDRSGSEFDTATTGSFFTLRPAVEQVVAQLDGQVRFGLGSFVGDHSSGACALNYLSVPIALNNAAAIKTAYDGWGPLQPYGSKADTPAVEAIPMVKAALQADTGTGQKYMMLVTDSETDFCDDGNSLCPADAVTYMIQDLYSSTPSIGTLVIGLPTSMSPIAPTVLKNLANAGVGQPVVVPTGTGAATAMDVYYQCTGQTNGGVDSWTSLWTAAGRAALAPLATYSATAGTATAFTPSSVDTDMLVAQISLALSGVRSCTFDLSTFTIDIAKLNEAEVVLVDSSGNRSVVPLDPTSQNGWYMTNITTSSSGMMTATELQLFGSACDDLRATTTMDIKFDFPCDIVIDKPN